MTIDSRGFLDRVNRNRSIPSNTVKKDITISFNDSDTSKINYITELYGTDFFKNKSILYFGCNNGKLPNHFSELGADVLCVEGRQSNIDKVKDSFPKLNIIRDDIDVKEWKYGKFDFIFHFNTLSHLYKYVDEHIINCINNCDVFLLDTNVLNSDVVTNIAMKEKSDDKSLYNVARKFSTSCIENIFSHYNIFHMRKEDVKLNYGDKKYLWSYSGGNLYDESKYRFWICFPMNKSEIHKNEDLTIIIQGKYNPLFIYAYEKYKKFSKDVILSVWKEPFYEKLPNDIKLIELDADFYDDKISKEKIYNRQNLYKQCITTYEALKEVKTKYVLKVRTDEFYSNIDHIYNLLMENDSKIVTSNFFFRRDSHYKFHISDKIIASKTHVLLKGFKYLIKKLNKKEYNIGEYRIDKMPPEPSITCSVLSISNKKIRLGISKQLMLENFNCVDVNKLYPFVCKWNENNKTFMFPINSKDMNIIKDMSEL